jgi:leader peptidase (prepilin peptidase) / N-methyltransferase
MDTISEDTLHFIFGLASFILGGLIGSFLNVCVHRIPLGLSVVKPRSRCPKCENELAWYDNVPVLSWLILGAKCRNCKLPISWQYPLVEAITAVLFYMVYLKFGMTIATPIYMLLMASLVVVTFVDLTDWTIPDRISIGGQPVGVLSCLIAMAIPNSGLLLDNIVMSIAGIVLGFGSLWLLNQFSLLVFKKHGMGGGDVKLMAMLGAFFGPLGVLLIMILSSVVGSAISLTIIQMNNGKETDVGEGNIGHYLPFGPYICLGAVIHIFVGPQIIEMYMGYVGMN